jgi:hypothetical protein
MLNPLERWEPGTVVRYHGSLTALHGEYQAHPCDCLRCADDRRAVRFALADDTGHIVIHHVQPRSITVA